MGGGRAFLVCFHHETSSCYTQGHPILNLQAASVTPGLCRWGGGRGGHPNHGCAERVVACWALPRMALGSCFHISSARLTLTDDFTHPFPGGNARPNIYLISATKRA